MKRTVLIFGVALLIVVSAVVFCISNGIFIHSAEFAKIPSTAAEAASEMPQSTRAPDADIPENDASGEASEAAEEDGPRLLFSFGGATLPETSDGEVLIPLIPETGLTVTTERGATLTKAQTGDGEWRVTAEKGGHTRTVTLKETGIGVCALSVDHTAPQSSADPSGASSATATGSNGNTEPIGTEYVDCTLNLFYIDDAGRLALDTCPVSAAIRGSYSRRFTKKSYTLKIYASKSRQAARSLMGLPADTKFQLNSMYEDDSKIRDILSMDLWQQMLSPTDGVDALRTRYTELFIDGEYRGLYGFGQVLTPATCGLSTGDGLVKLGESLLVTRKSIRNAEVLQAVTGVDIAVEFTDALYAFAEGDEASLALFDPENLMRVFVFIQTTAAADNTFKNYAGIRRGDRGVYVIALFDTDATFGHTTRYQDLEPRYWIPSAFFDLSTPRSGYTDECFRPLPGLLLFGGRFKQPLAELYFSFRETFLTEEKLLASAKELFDLVTDSGARERELARWPGGAYAVTNEDMEAFIVERLAWCDAYFAGLAEEGSAQTGE